MTNVDKKALEACVEWRKVKSKIEVFELRKYQTFFINFLFQYNILPTFGLSKMRSGLWAALATYT